MSHQYKLNTKPKLYQKCFYTPENQDILINNFNVLFEITNVSHDWKYLEKFMEINDKKILERKPLGKIFPPNDCVYRTGIVIEKKNDIIIFTTYTPLNKVCTMQHISYHTCTLKLLRTSINYYNNGIKTMTPHDDYDVVGYVSNILYNILKDIHKSNNETFWDVIE